MKAGTDVAIHIKKENRGLLHKKMGIPQGKKIGEGALSVEKSKAKKTHNVKLLREVVFAQNFGGHNK